VRFSTGRIVRFSLWLSANDAMPRDFTFRARTTVVPAVTSNDDDPLAPIDYPNNKPNVVPFVVPRQDSCDLLPTVDYPGATQPSKVRKPRSKRRPKRRKRRRTPLESPFNPLELPRRAGSRP
jgi:hypothetical protein